MHDERNKGPTPMTPCCEYLPLPAPSIESRIAFLDSSLFQVMNRAASHESPFLPSSIKTSSMAVWEIPCFDASAARSSSVDSFNRKEQAFFTGFLLLSSRAAIRLFGGGGTIALGCMTFCTAVTGFAMKRGLGGGSLWVGRGFPLGPYRGMGEVCACIAKV